MSILVRNKRTGEPGGLRTPGVGGCPAAPPLPSSSSNAWGGPQVYFLLWVLTLLPLKICFQIPTNVDNFFFPGSFLFSPKVFSC